MAQCQWMGSALKHGNWLNIVRALRPERAAEAEGALWFGPENLVFVSKPIYKGQVVNRWVYIFAPTYKT